MIDLMQKPCLANRIPYTENTFSIGDRDTLQLSEMEQDILSSIKKNETRIIGAYFSGHMITYIKLRNSIVGLIPIRVAHAYPTKGFVLALENIINRESYSDRVEYFLKLLSFDRKSSIVALDKE